VPLRRATGPLDVFTFKEGLLARAAHDLHLRLDAFTATLDGEQLNAEIPLFDLHLLGPVEGGATRPERYDAARRAEVEATMRDQILRLHDHPTATFDGRATPRAGGFGVDGTFHLAGARAPLTFAVCTENGVHRATFELAPSRWGIRPYRALMGTIRLADRVRIELALTET
jgi:hypothetical protein